MSLAIDEVRGMVPRAELYRALARIDELKAEIVDLRRRIGLEHKSHVHLQWMLKLTPLEARVLTFMMAHKACSRRALYHAIYDDGPDAADIKILDVYVFKLRKKMAAANAPENSVLTIWGSGWRLSEEGRAWVETIMQGAEP